MPFPQKIYDVEVIYWGERVDARIGSNGHWKHNHKCEANTCNNIGNRMMFGKGTDKWTFLCHVKAYAKLVVRPGEYKCSFLQNGQTHVKHACDLFLDTRRYRF